MLELLQHFIPLQEYFTNTSRPPKNSFVITTRLILDFLKTLSSQCRGAFKTTSRQCQNYFETIQRPINDYFKTTPRLKLTSRSLQRQHQGSILGNLVLLSLTLLDSSLVSKISQFVWEF